MEEIVDGDTTWRFDVEFLTSNWTCIFGRGCVGILPEPAEHLGHGCCSFGADLDGEDEAMLIGAMAATLEPAGFQQHAAMAAGGFLADVDRLATRVVDGACIFLNRPGFAGGHGCALHLAALANDESPTEWKPSVCWQLPVHVDWEERDEQTEVATVRAWRRDDWGDDGDTMAWCSNCSGSSIIEAADSAIASSSPSSSAPIEQQPWPSSGAGSARMPWQPRPKMHVQLEVRKRRSNRHTVSPASTSTNSPCVIRGEGTDRPTPAGG